MDPNQQQQSSSNNNNNNNGSTMMIMRAIAVSSLHLPQFTAADRQAAFQILQDLKVYDGRIPLCITWLHQATHVYYEDQVQQQQAQQQQQQQQAQQQSSGTANATSHDITTATKLLALEILGAFLTKGYSTIQDSDRLALRQAVLRAAVLAATNSNSNSTNSNSNTNVQAQAHEQENRILAKKLAVILEGLVIRDFPQRWTTFTADLFAPLSAGGLWYNEPGAAAIQQHQLTGVNICLECLKLVAEDCTDSDFNAKVSTSRRNDVLTGLNEVSAVTLPLFFQLLEHYPLLQQSKTTIHNMHTYLASNNRTVGNMTADEAAMYRTETLQRRDTAQLLADTLTTLEKFCGSMPVTWMLGGPPHDFVAAFQHLLREPDCQIQIRAVECLEQLLLRGKMEFSQWMRLVTELPGAVNEANAAFAAAEQAEHQAAERSAKGLAGTLQDSLTLQLDFHRALSRMMATVLSSHVSHITSNKKLLSAQGPHAEQLGTFLRLLVDILHHPSGRICTEQLNTWVALLRDPQIVKAQILQPYVAEILSCYMDKMARIRWDDVENRTHPQTELLEASFDDEEEYDIWMADLRSRASLLFKFIGNTEPQISARVLNARVQSVLATHGNGDPANFLDPSNQQLTPKSDAVIQLEALYQPMDNVIGGIPTWALEVDNKPLANTDHKGRLRAEIRTQTRASLSELAQALVSWNPGHVWLKFRRAQLLDTVKYYWKHDPSTLLQAIDSLLRYLGTADEWYGATNAGNGESLSGEIVSLKKKSGVTLVSVSKHVPQHLIPWLSQLSVATKSLLSSDGLIPMNQMHLYEFLSCVASEVEDPVARANFIGDVLSNAVEILESPEVQQSVASVTALLTTMGVTQAADRPESVTDPMNVKTVTDNYNRFFNALNQLLSVGKRCSEAARKRNYTKGFPGTNNTTPSNQLNFPDEGPVSIQELAVNDPFVPLWPRILPTLLKILEATLGIWRPEHQAILLQNRYQRYIYAISDDEVFTIKMHDAKSGGVFSEEGGTAGSVIAGANRRDVNLVPKWAGWFNELRNTSFQMLGLLATGRALFAPELSGMYPRLVAVMADPINLKSMEHRFITQFLKHVVELMLVSCPSTLYASHLGPLVTPIFEHMQYRLDKSWLPVLGTNGSMAEATRALTTSDCEKAAQLASRGNEEWFSYYYAHSGLFVGDLDSVTAEAAVEKHRVEIGRTFSDVIQGALALKGDWALVLANQSKEEQAAKRNDSSKLIKGPANSIVHDEGCQLNADGTRKTENQAAVDARKMLRINALCHFLLLENERIAGSLTMTVIQAMSYPDAYTCRRITRICHRILETVAWSPTYSQLLGQQMFTQAVKNIATEPKWMVGIEWDMIAVIRDIYCRLVLGQILQSGGQGPGLQQSESLVNANQYEQAKTVDRPLQGGGILVTPSDMLRQILLSLPGIGIDFVEEFERTMKRKRASKDQKDIIRDMLRVAADNLKEMNPTSANAATSGLFDRAVEEESLLHYKTQQKAVPDLPEKLVTHSQMTKKQASKKNNQYESEGLSAFQL